MTRTFLLFWAISLSLPILRGGHGETPLLEKAHKARQEKFSNKIANESLPVKWSADGDYAFLHLQDENLSRQWMKLRLEFGELSRLGDQSQPPQGEKSTPLKKSNEILLRPTQLSPLSPDKRLIVRVGKQGGFALQRAETKEIVFEEPNPVQKGWHWEEKVLWSPDSTRFVIWRNTNHPVRKVNYVVSSPEKQLQPDFLEIDYPKPGDPLNIARPIIFSVDHPGKPALELDSSLAKQPFDIRRPLWRADSRRFVFEYIERGFGAHQLIEIDTESRSHRLLIDERDEKFILVFGNSHRSDLKGGDEILWLSEQDGWNHLYLIDGKTGKVIRRLTHGDWVVRNVIRVDEENRSVLISLSGISPAEDPYHLHFATIDLDTGKMIRLTDGDGHHELFFSPNQKHYLAKWSRVDQPPTHEIRRTQDGKLIYRVDSGNTQMLEAEGWKKPIRFSCKDRQNEFDIFGMILLPTDFDSSLRYPVIEAIYAGPHGSFTPKRWQLQHRIMQEMAEAGFIVVKLDALGTNHRGKKFHQIAYKNLIDSGFPDREKWIRSAAQKVPQMDLERIGIYGGSAGGQSALAALLTQGHFYKAAAADCGCHDNRMDKIWWNEQWLDWPVDESYERNSNLKHIENLEGDLFLSVAELDRNVDPSSTLQVVNALIQNDKDFEFLLVPNAGHGVGERPYLRRKRIEFFKRSLGDPE